MDLLEAYNLKHPYQRKVGLEFVVGFIVDSCKADIERGKMLPYKYTCDVDYGEDLKMLNPYLSRQGIKSTFKYSRSRKSIFITVHEFIEKPAPRPPIVVISGDEHSNKTTIQKWLEKWFG